MAEPSLNPLLAKVKLPGRVFQLPSKGVFYKPGVLADSVKDGEIQVKPMSALVELKIRSADLLISAKIIREVCNECVPEILQPERMLAQDVDALFLFLVASTYGNQKQVRAIHDCEKAEVHEYTVNLEPIIADPRNKILEHRDILLTVDLDNGQIVKLKPVAFIDAVDMLLLRQAISVKELNTPAAITSKELEDLVVRDIVAVIDSVSTGGATPQIVSDQKNIDEWIRALPRKYVDLITEASIRAANWGFDLTVDLVCKDCSASFKHNLEMNPINFFSG